MAALKFASSHNMVAFLDKPTESDGFEQIVDFLNAHPIKYALTVNPTIYTSCIEQFWTTAKVKTINGEVQIQALVDKKKVIITETSIRSDLQLEDAEGTECLPNATIFEQLTLMGYENLTQKLTFYKAFFSPQWKFLIHTILQCLSAKTTAWNEFSSTMASAVILFLDKQVEGMSKHKEIYVTPSHTKKVFANMKRQGKDFSGRDTPLFPTMTVQAQEQVGEGSEIPTDSHHTEERLKRRVKKLEKKKGSRTQRLRILYKVGRSTRVVSSEDECLGAQEDASKQGRKIDEINQDAEVTLVDETQGSTVEVTIDSATTTTTQGSKVVVREPSEFTTTTSPSQSSQLPEAKNKGKAKMIEPEEPLKKKDQIMYDQEVALNLQTQ
ncbi:hypothetical protein Tco_1390272, partial [Tanacetum coccineum]